MEQKAKKNSRFVSVEKNREILDRLRIHFNARNDKLVFEGWGKNYTAMNNWRQSGFPKNELALLALKENLNLDWIIKGTGEKDVPVIPESHLSGLLEENGDVYLGKLCRIFGKVDDRKKGIASKEAIEVLLKYY